MADKIQLKLVTPRRLLLDEEVDEVTAPGALGQFGVLPNHIAFLTLLDPGEVSYKQGAERAHLAVSGGYAEVLNNVMTVLADNAEYADEIDVAAARIAKEQAEARLVRLNPDDEGFTATKAALTWALARLQVADRDAQR